VENTYITTLGQVNTDYKSLIGGVDMAIAKTISRFEASMRLEQELGLAVPDDGWLDGGEPYTEEELMVINARIEEVAIELIGENV